ncbi:MAG: DUF962 domain-containing protein [Deltaproteobacteria bacterium]|nr:DUF962 domain-containing protein [Deltaproteobacteria bacterium]
MKSLLDRLASYAEYHRDKRNIATHFVGIPMILVGTQATLARIGIGPINAAIAATALATKYYGCSSFPPDSSTTVAIT